MRELDCDYYDRRRRECLAQAAAATNATIACVHRDFAAAYEQKLLQMAMQRSRLSVWN